MKIKSVLTLSALALVNSILTGCMSMPISTMYKMATFSPLDMKPREIRVAVRTNEAVEIKDGAVTIKMSYTTEGNETLPAVTKKHTFYVEVINDLKADFVPMLMDGIEPRERIAILKLRDVDAQVMSETLNLVRQYKAQDITGTGSFSIGTNGSCFGNLEEFETLEVDVFMQTAFKNGYFVFVEDLDIVEQARDYNVDLKQTNRCATD